MMQWYVIQSRHRDEDFLCRQLQSRGMEAYLPCIHLRSKSQNTWKVKAYFPGYLFLHADLHVVGISRVQWIPGSMGLVCFGGEPAWIPDDVLRRIRDQVDRINLSGSESWQNLKPGDDIAIRSGPFAGYCGIFSSYLSDRERVIIFLKFIRDQQIRVELPMGQVLLKKQDQV